MIIIFVKVIAIFLRKIMKKTGYKNGLKKLFKKDWLKK